MSDRCLLTKKNRNSILLLPPSHLKFFASFPEAVGTFRPIFKLLGVMEVRKKSVVLMTNRLKFRVGNMGTLANCCWCLAFKLLSWLLGTFSSKMKPLRKWENVLKKVKIYFSFFKDWTIKKKKFFKWHACYFAITACL